jgi:hypothetical protein
MTRQVHHDYSHGWCTLHLRFDARELELLRGAEQLRGAALAHTARSDVLRTALALAKAGHKLGAGTPGTSIGFEEAEVGLLLEALRFATEEIHHAARQDGQPVPRHEAVLAAFPELAQKGMWRSFGLGRELEALTHRLHVALEAH